MRFLFPLFSLLFLNAVSYAAEKVTARTDWGSVFRQFDAQGTIVVADERGGIRSISVYDEVRAQKRFSPASTFKIPHTLFALDAALIFDEFQVFKWDGVVRGFSRHNQDQNVRSAMRTSALWVYEGLANQLGEDRARKYLKKIDYRNADLTTSKGNYWVDGKLAISAHEQVAFLKLLYQNKLPFSVAHQRLVKDIMIVEAGSDWILRAKTGWDGRMGWWVGWVEWPTGPVFFALNIDTPNRMADLGKRQDIGEAILRSIRALPASPTEK